MTPQRSLGALKFAYNAPKNSRWSLFRKRGYLHYPLKIFYLIVFLTPDEFQMPLILIQTTPLPH